MDSQKSRVIGRSKTMNLIGTQSAKILKALCQYSHNSENNRKIEKVSSKQGQKFRQMLKFIKKYLEPEQGSSQINTEIAIENEKSYEEEFNLIKEHKKSSKRKLKMLQNIIARYSNNILNLESPISQHDKTQATIINKVAKIKSSKNGTCKILNR